MIAELRRQIDALDTQIVTLLCQRIALARQIGQEKNKQGQEIADPGREAEVLRHVQMIAQENGLVDDDLPAIYRQIIQLCKKAQE